MRGFITCPSCGVTLNYRLWTDYRCPNCREVFIALYREEDADPDAATKSDETIRRELEGAQR